jgi:hypothetical protein
MRLARLLALALLLFVSTGIAFAQRPPSTQPLSPDDEAAAAASCAACGGCGVVAIMLIAFAVIAGIVVNILLLVWVAKDAKSRGMDNAVVWVLLVVFTGLIGLLVYILSRPAGELILCKSCGNKRLQMSAKCPHCGNA